MAYGLTKSLDLESGSSQYASRADTASLSITGDITVECWIKFESKAGSGSANTFASKWNSGGNNRSWLFGWDNGNSIVGGNALYVFFDETGQNDGNSTRSYASWNPSTAVWYHVAMTFDAGAPSVVALYIDGTSQSVTNDFNDANSIYDGNASTAIGAINVDGTPILFYDGLISLVRIWNVVRTQGQIDANKCEVLGSTANLQAEWTLDDVYTDNSGNGNTLTASGSPVFATDTPSVCSVVGPAGVKTWNGVTQSTGIKTYLGVALASTKSVIGIT